MLTTQPVGTCSRWRRAELENRTSLQANPTIAEAFKIAEKVSGIPAPRREISPTTLKLIASVSWLTERIIPIPNTYSSESLHVLAVVTYLGSNEKAKRELGFTCRPLEDGFRETLAYEKQLLANSDQ
jgi:nucleoside-diphosphate-sugar epimerase